MSISSKFLKSPSIRKGYDGLSIKVTLALTTTLTNTQGWLHAAGVGHGGCCTRKGLETTLDSWFLAEDLCVVQWHARRCMLYLNANQNT